MFTLGGNHTFVMQPHEYLNYFADRSCFIGFIPSGYDFWILGANFLRAYYSVYDMANNRVGLIETW